MRVVFASHGSLGDLVPFLEVGKVLAARGHAVRIATHGAHEKAVRAAGLAFAPMRPERPDDPRFHARLMSRWSGASFVFNDYLVPAIAESDADLTAAAKGADVLVSVTLALAAPIVAARERIAWRSAVFQPAMLYSIHDPPRLPLLPFIRGRPDYNAWVLQSAKKGIDYWTLALKHYRINQGFGDYPDHPLFGGQHSPQRVLALYSPLFGELPADAPANTVQTGQVLQATGRSLPSPVAQFLDAGPAPLVFTLGSASAHSARRFFAISARIAEVLRMRALLLVGNPANLAGLPRRRDLLAITTAPYEEVFGRARLVVHQGGIGTIALALAAGKPMVLVPFAHDQIDNSARAARLGAARVVPRAAYRWRAGAVISEALADDRLATAAARAQTIIRSEQGAGRAADEIEAAGRAGPR